ncbi:MAG: Mov34/MPN/PAD-1 family protein [Candidatus Caldarchaeum sp.]|nr:Mov34/MPN/PAD-1 family protein [Candidatus Caldarchaeum sp.]MCS7134031.1 Mov34/MPN/PAD-1 family protein [Candidatus Caldarchaeum sp.]MDW8435708.1 Mov34/MPN/PAD-1 family protein [Candidatus Caldarchaeum sp.]
MGLRKVSMSREVAGLLLEVARSVDPDEMIVLLHGKVNKDYAVVEEVSFPPQSIYGDSFSSFNPYSLPIDHSILGIAHSHPSGIGRPSAEDLDNFMGVMMVIVTAPYRDEKDIHVLDAEGRKIRLEIV